MTSDRKSYGGKSRRMRGGYALMPATVSEFNAGNFVESQHAAGTGLSGPAPNVSLAQSGGKSKKRRMNGGYRGTSTFADNAEQVPSQKGGYMAELLQAAAVPFGLIGLNKFAHTYAKRKPYMGKSRLSKKIRSHRKRR